MITTKDSVPRIAVLDALRGVAAFGVAYFYHWVWVFGSVESVNYSLLPGAGISLMDWLYTYGYLLVELFFVVSGFVFVYVYFEKIRNNKIDFISFIKLRVARLWPMFVLSSLLVFGIQTYRLLFNQGIFYPEIPFKVSDLFLSFGFLQSGIFNSKFAMNAPLWSVSVEMVMYLLFFFAVKYSLKTKHCCAVTFLGLLVVGVAISEVQTNFLLFNPFISRALVGFFSGTLLFFISERLSSSRLMAGHKRLVSLFIMWLILILFGLLWLDLGAAVFGNLNIIYSMLVFPLVILISLNSEYINRLASLRPFKTLGDMSYVVYVMSFPLALAFSTALDTLGFYVDFYSKKVFVVFVLTSLGVSYLIYRVLDKPSHAAMKKALRV